MAFFEELNGIVMGTLGEYVLKNQRLCKLLYYYPDDQRPNYDPFIQPDIEDTSQLMFTHVFPVPKLPDAVLDHILLPVKLTKCLTINPLLCLLLIVHNIMDSEQKIIHLISMVSN